MDLESIRNRVRGKLAEVSGLELSQVNDETRLIGSNAVVESQGLVELLLAMEDFAEDELATSFDWSSDSAMSRSRSLFRTVGTLAHHLHSLQS